MGLAAQQMDSGGARTKPGQDLLVRQSLLHLIPLFGSFRTLPHPYFIPAVCLNSIGSLSATQRVLVKWLLPLSLSEIVSNVAGFSVIVRVQSEHHKKGAFPL